MTADLIISADFRDPASAILAGTSEDELKETPLKVADTGGRQLDAVKLLGRSCNTVLVLSRLKDRTKGWLITRRLFRRVKRLPPPPASG